MPLSILTTKLGKSRYFHTLLEITIQKPNLQKSFSGAVKGFADVFALSFSRLAI